jgi:hypothetical protein
VRRRLIVAFIVVALLAVIASAWLTTVIDPFFPALHGLIRCPSRSLSGSSGWPSIRAVCFVRGHLPLWHSSRLPPFCC